MNYSTAIVLVDKSVRVVAVTYEPSGGRTLYKTVDPDICVGEIVVVPAGTRHLFTTAKVEEVDCDIDFDSAVQVGWIVGTVPMSDYEDIVEREAAAIAKIKAADIRTRREKMADSLLKENPELGSLAITPALVSPPTV